MMLVRMSHKKTLRKLVVGFTESGNTTGPVGQASACLLFRRYKKIKTTQAEAGATQGLHSH